MVMSPSSARQAVAKGSSRIGKDVADLLYAIIKGEPYQSAAGSPVGSVTPRAIGERYLDTTNSVFYRAYGLTSADWGRDGGATTSRLLAAGATKTLTISDDGKTVLLDTAAGSVVTLPAASGSGARFRFQVKVLATSNSHKVQVANATDIIQGLITGVSDDTDAVKGWIAGATADTITLNRTTTGSVSRGEFIEIEDVAAGLFLVHGQIAQTGTEATPFSAAVS